MSETLNEKLKALWEEKKASDFVEFELTAKDAEKVFTGVEIAKIDEEIEVLNRALRKLVNERIGLEATTIKTENLIRSNEAEALTSSCPYVRKYIKLLQTETKRRKSYKNRGNVVLGGLAGWNGV